MFRLGPARHPSSREPQQVVGHGGRRSATTPPTPGCRTANDRSRSRCRRGSGRGLPSRNYPETCLAPADLGETPSAFALNQGRSSPTPRTAGPPVVLVGARPRRTWQACCDAYSVVIHSSCGRQPIRPWPVGRAGSVRDRRAGRAPFQASASRGRGRRESMGERPRFYPAKPPAHWLMCAEVSGRVLVVPLAPPRSGDPRRCRPIGCYEATHELATQYRRDR